MINLIEIQESLFFENDGEIDLLTGAMAPNRFDQIVKRDVEIAERNGSSLAIISLKLDLENLLAKEFKDVSINTIKSEIESFLIKINFDLKSITRGSDCISRVSQTGFWIFINAATPDGLQLLKNRIMDLIPTNMAIEIIPRNKNQNQLSWYQSIDLKHFK
jgi:hypothetical protein